MVTKTREKLIEVARQLFAHKGIENTTMNDIATASEKGRRTIYTYFKNKREIYNAVIERESEHLVARLREVVDSNLEPVEKLRVYLETRFDIVDDAVHKQDSSLKTLFGRDFRRIDKIRRLAIVKEQELFSALIHEGVATGCFRREQAERLLTLETVVFQGVDYSHLRNNFNELGFNRESLRSRVVGFLVDGVINNNTDNEQSE
nr:TetR family transcriptional regulator [Bacteroides sp.]